MDLKSGGAAIPPFRRGGGRRPLLQEAHRVNRKILSREVRVIGDEGKQLGVMPTHIACRIAEEKGLDLVEVNPKGEPPVCKIIDYGRFKYEEARKKRANKKKQTVVQIKEIKLRPKTDTHDLDVKVRAIMRFLAEGNKAKLVIQFRGREIVHPETGKAVLHKVLTELGDLAVVEQWPMMEGRRMNMMVAPRPGAVFPTVTTKASEKAQASAAAAAAAAAAVAAAAPVAAPAPVKEEDAPQGESGDTPSPPAA